MGELLLRFRTAAQEHDSSSGPRHNTQPDDDPRPGLDTERITGIHRNRDLARRKNLTFRMTA